VSTYPTYDMNAQAQQGTGALVPDAPATSTTFMPGAERGVSVTSTSSEPSGPSVPGARIKAVLEDSPAYDAGFEPGCIITAVNGAPLRDIIDWRWESSEDVIELSYVDNDGEEGTVELERNPEEEWGIEFDGVVFDGVKLCRNACTFCFMRQLPANLRPSLSLRDDDFRLSFLSGTFVTMTNVFPEDEARIIEQHISPLRVSLHAVSPQVREQLMGKHAAWGMQVIERLLDAGIEMHMQIVLVPGVNDGEELKRTLEWAYEQQGIVEIGIVPLGYTRHQDIFQRSFNSPYAAVDVLRTIEPFQRKARRARKHAWVYAADEFYRNAYQDRMLDRLPSASFYGEFGMFEDGVGIIRTIVDDWHACVEKGLVSKLAQELQKQGTQAVIVMGYAMMPFFGQLVEASDLNGQLLVLAVENNFFGGNVDVTGLLTSYDVAQALVQGHISPNTVVVIPKVVLNDDGIMLDNGTLDSIREQSGITVHAVSCNPSGFLREILQLIAPNA
jgi:putative radical SAM enzyme (TIGR03279 family)